jgi:hypothetical protein
MKEKTEAAPLAPKRQWQRKLRHASRVQKLKALPKVKEGKPLECSINDERAWMDW